MLDDVFQKQFNAEREEEHVIRVVNVTYILPISNPKKQSDKICGYVDAPDNIA